MRYAEKNGTSSPCEYCGSLSHLSANTRSMGRYAQPRTATSAATCHTATREAAAGAGASVGAKLTDDIRVPESARRAGFWQMRRGRINTKFVERGARSAERGVKDETKNGRV